MMFEMDPDEARDAGRDGWGPAYRACDRCFALTDPYYLRLLGRGEETGYRYMVCIECWNASAKLSQGNGMLAP